MKKYRVRVRDSRKRFGEVTMSLLDFTTTDKLFVIATTAPDVGPIYDGQLFYREDIAIEIMWERQAKWPMFNYDVLTIGEYITAVRFGPHGDVCKR